MHSFNGHGSTGHNTIGQSPIGASATGDSATGHSTPERGSVGDSSAGQTVAASKAPTPRGPSAGDRQSRYTALRDRRIRQARQAHQAHQVGQARQARQTQGARLSENTGHNSGAGRTGYTGRTGQTGFTGFPGRKGTAKARAGTKRVKSSITSLWLYTYADFMTLLLTFFVLIFSMSSMDSSVLARISLGASGLAFSLPSEDKAQIKRISELEILLKETGKLQHNLVGIKNLLLPVEDWPMEIPIQLRDSLVTLVETDEGVVLILSGDLLFVDGDSTLNVSAQRLLDVLTPVIQGVDFDVNISGFTARGESLRHVESLYASPITSRSQAEYMLSAERALSVLRHLSAEAKIQERLSISGYGPDKPVYTAPADEYKNRRVEILFKVKKRLGGYA